MFSGIVEQVGSISKITSNGDGCCLTISTDKPLTDLEKGESISVSGICLTVVDFADNCFSVEATHETLRRTKLGSLSSGDEVNVERALKLSDRLGGHLVSGHIDTVASVKNISQEGFSSIVTFALDESYMSHFVEKGSVTVDGVSLTVTSCAGAVLKNKGAISSFTFSVSLIPYTLEATTLGNLKVGDCVNIETDIIAKYVNRLLSPTLAQANSNTEQEAMLTGSISEDPLLSPTISLRRGGPRAARVLNDGANS